MNLNNLTSISVHSIKIKDFYKGFIEVTHKQGKEIINQKYYSKIKRLNKEDAKNDAKTAVLESFHLGCIPEF